MIHIDNKEFEKVNPFESFIDRTLFDQFLKDPKFMKERKEFLEEIPSEELEKIFLNNKNIIKGKIDESKGLLENLQKEILEMRLKFGTVTTGIVGGISGLFGNFSSLNANKLIDNIDDSGNDDTDTENQHTANSGLDLGHSSNGFEPDTIEKGLVVNTTKEVPNVVSGDNRLKSLGKNAGLLFVILGSTIL